MNEQADSARAEPSPSEDAGARTSDRWRAPHRVLLLLVGVGAALSATFIRIRATLALDGFEYDHAEGLLKSDPGLLYYITKRIVEAGGSLPSDFRADPRIEWPLTTDIPGIEAVGQELLVAWAYLLLGGEVPLHVVAMVTMSLTASLCVVGVIGLSWELTRELRWVALAALAYVLCLANYRTIGFILIREDLSLPLFSLHLWLLARAARTQTQPAIVAAALSFVAALSTWHAMQFVGTIEVACLFAWFLRSGQNPLQARGAWPAVLLFVIACLLVPVLLAKRTIASPLAALLFALSATALLERRWQRVADRRRSVALGLIAVGVVAGPFLGSVKDYSHVYSLLLHKLLNFGVLPVDPGTIDFEARVMWQGPFESARLVDVMYMLGPLAVLLLAGLVLMAREWLQRAGDAPRALLGALGAASIVAAMIMERLYTLAGLLAPVIAVLVLRSLPRRTAGALVVGTFLAQAIVFGDMLSQRQLHHWYRPQALPVLRGAMTWIDGHLDPSGAIATDFVTSTMVLAHTRHAAVVQPKYETLRSRQRIERMFSAFFKGRPEQLHRLLQHDFRARYFLLDGPMMWNHRYAAGLPVAAPGPLPGTSAAVFMPAPAPGQPEIPGFRLLYAAPQDGAWLRIYELVPLR